MKVTSSNFQQSVGYYLELADNGQEVEITKKRPFRQYIDKGYETSKKFIIKNLCYKSQQIIKQKLYIDAKSQLQSTAQEIFRITPTYELVSSEGPDHDKIFTMALVIGEHKLTSGSGKSKQEAEQAAAEKALLKWDEIVKQVSVD